MLRHIFVAVLLGAGPCFAEPLDSAPATDSWGAPLTRPDPFVIAGDACDASAYAHLVGDEFRLHLAALPQGAVVHGPAERGALGPIDTGPEPARGPLSLEYRPGRLNVVVDSSLRIAAVGCH